MDDQRSDDKIDLSGQISLSFLKKRRFTGSFKGMRYILFMSPEDMLRAEIWPEPMNYECTPEEKKHGKDFSLSEEGLKDAIAWLNGEYQAGRF